MTTSIKTVAALGVAAVAAAAMYTLTIPAFAVTGTPTLFGGASQNANSVTLVSNLSDAGTANDYSGISWTIPSSTTLGSLASMGDLSAVYNVGSTNCGGGSPRFQINVSNGTTTGTIFAYLGPGPNYNTCSANTATSSGNLLSDSVTLDTSQLSGGSFYDTWTHALATYGGMTVTGVQLVVDGGWSQAGGMQSVEITGATLGGGSYTFGAPATTSLSAPTLVSPANGSTLTSAQWTLADWTDVSASSTPVTYLYESSNSSATNGSGGFTTPLYQSGSLSSSQISTAGTGPGTYYWHARAVDNNGTMSPWSATFSVTVNNAATSTGGNGGSAQDLAAALQALQAQYPQFYWNLQWVINDLMNQGGSNGGGNNGGGQPAGTPSIDNNGMTVSRNGTIDFVGRNFGHEENVSITLSGSLLRTVHADGGGNFSTGSMQAPGTAGTYQYVFTGATSGRTATSTITVH